MPLHFCHPNIPHRKLRMPEWFVSSLMMDRALDAVVRLPRRVRTRLARSDRSRFGCLTVAFRATLSSRCPPCSNLPRWVLG
jgi:hypothetical protein